VSQREIAKKNTKTFILGVGSRSFKVIDIDTPKNPVTNVGYNKQHMPVPISNRFHAGLADSGKIQTFGGTPF